MGMSRVFWPIALVSLALICARPVESQSFVYEGCSQEQYSAGSNYENNLNSLLGNLLRQASDTDYYNASAGSGSDAVYGLYDCRGDLSGDDCAKLHKERHVADLKRLPSNPRGSNPARRLLHALRQNQLLRPDR